MSLIYNTNIPKNNAVNFAAAFPGSVTCPAFTNVAENVANQGDQLMMDNTIKSYILEKGYPVLYYPYLFELDKAEHLYGEHSAAGYAIPFKTYAYISIEDAPAWVAAQGFDTDETATIWIHIQFWRDSVIELMSGDKEKYRDYFKIYNLNYKSEGDVVRAIEPKVKDLIQLMTFGADREFDRGNKIFEITSKEDEVFSDNMNPAMGHYVWKITAKRYRFSHEMGLSNQDLIGKDNPFIGVGGESGNHVVSETKSVYKMFLEAEGIVDEANIDMITEDGNIIGGVHDITSVKIEQKNLYDYDIVEESKSEYNLEENIDEIYTDGGNKILSNNLF
jgi:hypothetical protein